MKKILPIILTLLSVSIMAQNDFATIATASGDTLHCASGNGNKTTVVYNPTFDLYYSVNAGGSQPNEYYNSNGVFIGSNTTTDWRGLWFNPNSGQIEGNTWNQFIFIDSLTSLGYFSPTSFSGIQSLFPSNSPFNQCAGDYDDDDNRIYYYRLDSLYPISRVDGSSLPTVGLSGVPSSASLSPYIVTYIGVPNKEIGIYERTNNKLYLFNKNTGLLTDSVAMPTNAPSLTGSFWGYSFANNIFWVLDIFQNKWIGYNIFETTCANIVNIPDANFKAALLNHSPVIDTDGDGEICVSEAQAYTGTINVSSKNISDMTGIETFINLTELNCTYNTFSNLNVSSNTALLVLNCSFNSSLTSLNVSANTSLRELFCAENALTSLNVANGANGVSFPNLYYVVTTTNPNLSCIQHDSGFDPTSTSNWQKDATASWSDDCSVVLVNSITVQGANGVDTIELGNTLQMEAMVLPANADDQTYSWSITVNTGDASINTNGQLIPQAIGNVTVLAAANDGSGVVGTKIITIIDSSQTSVGINSLAGFETVSVYPNPATDYVTVETGSEEITSIRILDITGKIVKTFNPASQKLNVSNINKGIYLLELANAEKHAVVKLVLQ